MKLGIWFEGNNERFEQIAKTEKTASAGIELESLLATIDLLEIKYSYDTRLMLAEIKKVLLLYSGRIKIEEDKKEEKE